MIITKILMITTAFNDFASNTHKDGSVIVCWDNEYCRLLLDDLSKDNITFGFSLGSDVRCLEYRYTNKGMRKNPSYL